MHWRDESLTKGEMHDALAGAIEAVEEHQNKFKSMVPSHIPGAKKLRDIIDSGFNAALDALCGAAISISGGKDNGREGR
jgi:hypothetical protein